MREATTKQGGRASHEMLGLSEPSRCPLRPGGPWGDCTGTGQHRRTEPAAGTGWEVASRKKGLLEEAVCELTLSQFSFNAHGLNLTEETRLARSGQLARGQNRDTRPGLHDLQSTLFANKLTQGELREILTWFFTISKLHISVDAVTAPCFTEHFKHKGLFYRLRCVPSKIPIYP